MKPVLLLDCDNVLLEFVRPLRDWLREHREIDYRIESFALLQNMRHLADGRVVTETEFAELMRGFFAEGQPTQPPLPGAVEAVSRLAHDMDVVVLTNLPERWRDIRVQHLRTLGFDAPVVANDGPKGPMVKQLAGGRPAVFVDDLPLHHTSVAEHAPGVGRLHMVGEEILRDHIPAAEAAEARIDLWAQAEGWIRRRLGKED